MIYNNGLAKCEWLRKKQEEEKILRKYGMSEELIEALRKSDWEEFKSERIFYLHNVQSIDDVKGADDDVRFSAEDVDGMEVFTVEAMLDEIEDARLFQILSEADKDTLLFLLLCINGYSLREISYQLGVNENTVSTKLKRLRNKIMNFS